MTDEKRQSLQHIAIEDILIDKNEIGYPVPLVDAMVVQAFREPAERRERRRGMIQHMIGSFARKHRLRAYPSPHPFEEGVVYISNCHLLYASNAMVPVLHSGDVQVATGAILPDIMPVPVRRNVLGFLEDYINGMIDLYKAQPWRR